MREGVLVSTVFFVAAVLLFLVATHLVPTIGYLRQVVLFLALSMIILAPVILISTFLISVLSGARAGARAGAREKLGKCDH